MSNRSKILNNRTIDATATVHYSDEVYLQSSTACAFGLEVVDDSTTLAITITLWAEGINSEGQAAGASGGSTTYDTGWVEMVAAHGWDGFPSGDPAGNDVLDAITLVNIGHRKLRFKLVRTAGTGVVSMAANVKANT